MTSFHAMIGVLQLPEVSALSPTLLITGVLVLLFLSITMLFVSRYRRCPANRVLVISGRVGAGESARVINGGGAFIWPVIQEYAFLDLTPLQIDINLTDALSLENIRVKVPSQVTVAVGDTPEFQQNAAARILNLTADATRELAANIIFGQMRQVIASMRIEDINRDRDQFRANIEHALEPELKKIGLKLINVNITDIADDSGYIDAIGKKAAAEMTPARSNRAPAGSPAPTSASSPPCCAEARRTPADPRGSTLDAELPHEVALAERHRSGGLQRRCLRNYRDVEPRSN